MANQPPSYAEPGPSKRDDDLHLQVFKPRRPHLMKRVYWTAAEFWDDYTSELNLARVMYHLISILYLSFMLFLVYWLLPIHGHWSSSVESAKVPNQPLDLSNYFNQFHGNSECNIQAEELYQPLGQGISQVSHDGYCSRRQDVLEALSSGGRVGFDAPYFPKGCHYHWYTVEEICMILERFQAVVFVGDDPLQTIYNGLNVLLRRDLSHGSLKSWDMDMETLRQRSCDSQFKSQACAEQFITSSVELSNPTDSGAVQTPYFCARTPHAILRITTSPAPNPVIEKFKLLVPRQKRSNYHPIPIIHSLSPSTASAEKAIASLEEFVALADHSHRKTPMLWIGPTAAGHVEIRGRKGNQEIWDFGEQVSTVAKDNEVDVLGMWNTTVQVNSWDGVRFAEKVAITQAMMVVNWLARLESS